MTEYSGAHDHITRAAGRLRLSFFSTGAHSGPAISLPASRRSALQFTIYLQPGELEPRPKLAQALIFAFRGSQAYCTSDLMPTAGRQARQNWPHDQFQRITRRAVAFSSTRRGWEDESRKLAMSGSNTTEHQRQGVIISRLGSAYASAITANSCLV